MPKKTVPKTRTGQIIYGAHSIIEMLKAKKRKLLTLYTTKPLPKAWNRLTPYLPKRIPNIQYVNREILDRMAGCTDHNKIVALTTAFKYAPNLPNPKKKPFILLLDSLQDARNVGAILRSAYCTGIDGVVMCQKKAAPLLPAVFKASAGLAEHLDIYKVSSLKQAIADLKKRGYNFYMAVLNGEKATHVTFKSPLCMVIGNEATGISKDLVKMGKSITLPQKISNVSYNASVAAGILMFLVSIQVQKL